jgi:hypothetical protein
VRGTSRGSPKYPKVSRKVAAAAEEERDTRWTSLRGGEGGWAGGVLFDPRRTGGATARIEQLQRRSECSLRGSVKIEASSTARRHHRETSLGKSLASPSVRSSLIASAPELQGVSLSLSLSLPFPFLPFARSRAATAADLAGDRTRSGMDDRS